MNGIIVSLTALFACWVVFLWPHWHGDLSHGPIAAGLAARLLWQRRGDWKPLPLACQVVLLPAACFMVAAGAAYRASVGPTAGAAVLVSLGFLVMVLGACGTKAIFPGAFLLITSVPAPGSVWLPVVTALQRLVALIDAEVLRFFGAPVVLEGAILRIGETVVSVDAACSGVRGIQMGVMVSLFLGVLFLGNTWRRWVLFGVSLVLVLLGNVARSLVLSFAGWRGGAQAIETFHDPVGWVVFLFSLASMGAICWVLRTPMPSADIRSHAAPVWPTWLPALSLAILIAGLFGHFWVTSAPLARGVIFEMRSEVPGWRFEPQRLPDAAIEMLLRPEIVNGVYVREADGLRVRVFFARWPDGAPQDVFGHTPEICWPGSGWKPAGNGIDAVRLNLADHPLLFNRRVFVAPTGEYEQAFWANFRGGHVVSDLPSVRFWVPSWWSVLRGRRGATQEVSFLRLSVVTSEAKDDADEISVFLSKFAVEKEEAL